MMYCFAHMDLYFVNVCNSLYGYWLQAPVLERLQWSRDIRDKRAWRTWKTDIIAWNWMRFESECRLATSDYLLGQQLWTRARLLSSQQLYWGGIDYSRTAWHIYHGLLLTTTVIIIIIIIINYY